MLQEVAIRRELLGVADQTRGTGGLSGVTGIELQKRVVIQPSVASQTRDVIQTRVSGVASQMRVAIIALGREYHTN